jgi:hypothetical protein
MKSRLLVIGCIVLNVTGVSFLLINTNFGNASVICVDKYNDTSVIPCSDQNAIDKNNVNVTQPSSGEQTNMTGSNMSSASGPGISDTLSKMGIPLGSQTGQGVFTGAAQSNSSSTTNDRYYEGINWWGVCNNPLLRSYISQSCDVLVTPDKNALTSKGKVVLEGILCPRGPSIVTTLELFYGTIPQKLENDLGVACGWH